MTFQSMSTLRLYYGDSLLLEFDATVVSAAVVSGHAHVVLDRTAFYPTSGGQPFDTGRLDDSHVVDVMDRDDGAIVHVMADGAFVPGQRVHGAIDWPRRLDHMQQHTGQHMLSAAFDRLFDVRTVSFHMGGDVSTIDLAREVSAQEIAAAEAEANRVVWEDRPVRVRIVAPEEARDLPLRKEPAREGPLRLVEVDDFDWSACGGTHVQRTGTVGLIAVAGWERLKGASRLTFVCGGRALRSHGAFRDVVVAATRALSVTPPEVAPAVLKLLEEARAASQTARGLYQELAVHWAADLVKTAVTVGSHRLVSRIETRWDAAVLKLVAAAVVKESGFVAVLVGGGEPAPLVVARAADVALDANAVVRAVTSAIGGRGGGRPELAQAGVPAGPDRVLAAARDALL